MWILLTLALGATDGGTPTAAAGEFTQARLAARPEEWLAPRAKPFGSAVRIAPAIRPGETLEDRATPADPAAINCAIRILKADPEFDARIVRPSPPDLDPKIVRRSPCRR